MADIKIISTARYLRLAKTAFWTWIISTFLVAIGFEVFVAKIDSGFLPTFYIFILVLFIALFRSGFVIALIILISQILYMKYDKFLSQTGNGIFYFLFPLGITICFQVLIYFICNSVFDPVFALLTLPYLIVAIITYVILTCRHVPIKVVSETLPQ